MEVGFDPIGFKRGIAEKILKKQTTQNFKIINTHYHGVRVKFQLEDEEIHDEIVKNLPVQWILDSSDMESDLEVIWHNSRNWCSDIIQFEEDANPDYRFDKIDRKLVIFQRDLVAVHLSKAKWLVCTNPAFLDGVVNFFRLVLPGYLLEKDSLVLHSNCVLGHDENVHIFLGESGAGKSTTAGLSGDRLVLGDDINIVTLSNDGLFAESSLLGGDARFKAPFDKRYPVGGFYWLCQDINSWFSAIDKATFVKRMMMSVILWTGNPDITIVNQKVLSLIDKISKNTVFYNMGFSRTSGDFYQKIENGVHHG